MPSMASRILGLAVLAAFIVLFLYFLKYLVYAALIVLAAAVLGGVLFYFRMRRAVRRFRKAFAQAQAQAARSQPAQQRRDGEVLEAEFKVKDER